MNTRTSITGGSVLIAAAVVIYIVAAWRGTLSTETYGLLMLIAGSAAKHIFDGATAPPAEKDPS